MEIKSEAKFTTFEAISMIVGNSIGTGIIAVPFQVLMVISTLVSAGLTVFMRIRQTGVWTGLRR